MVPHGILLFTFGLLLLAVKQVSETPVLLIPSPIPPPPVCLSTALRIILIVISLIFTIAGFWVLRSYKLAKFLKEWLKKVVSLIILLLLLFIFWLIPPIPVMPDCVFTALGIIALLTSLVFMVAVFWKWLAGKLEGFLQSRLRYTYWLLLFSVYTIGWLKGLLSIPVDGFAFKIAFGIGFVWVFVIAIIMLRSTRQPSRGFGRVELFVVQHVESPEEANPP